MPIGNTNQARRIIITDALDDLFDQAEERANEERWDFDEEPEIKGILVGVGYAPSAGYGPYFVLRVKTEDDTTHAIPMFGTVLNNQLQENAPKVGALIGIRFNGKKSNKAGDRQYKDWLLVTGKSDFAAWVDHNKLLQQKGSQPSTAASQPRPETGPVTDFF